MSIYPKKILFITPQLPYPPISGGTIVSFKTLQLLASKYEVHLVNLLKNDEDVLNEPILKEKFQASLESYKSFILEKKFFAKNPMNLLKSYVVRQPFSVYRNSNRSLKEYVETITKNFSIDIIFLDHFLTFQFIEDVIDTIKSKKIKILLQEHNSEYLIFQRYAEQEKNILKKVFAYIEAYRVREYEKKISTLVDYVLCVSSHDIDKLVDIGIDRHKLKLVTLVGDESLLHKEDLVFDDTEDSLLFVGTLSWEPNVDGLMWFIKNAWDKLKNKRKNLKFYVVGRNPPERLIEVVAQHKDIVLTGYVEDLEEYYRKCRVFVSPLRFGSGIKIKNINALYRGIPVVTTSVGVEGIDGDDSEHFFIADDIDTFMYKIELVLENKEIWQRLSRNAREFMKRKHSLDKTVSVLDEIMTLA
ncbi:MAG: glycosyl transferase [Candidatus Dojkabacteria bacterium]|nr:MAG: glycosyl transferase [Candidatus Dojkabacteria bacterium]